VHQQFCLIVTLGYAFGIKAFSPQSVSGAAPNNRQRILEIFSFRPRIEHLSVICLRTWAKHTANPSSLLGVIQQRRQQGCTPAVLTVHASEPPKLRSHPKRRLVRCTSSSVSCSLWPLVRWFFQNVVQYAVRTLNRLVLLFWV